MGILLIDSSSKKIEFGYADATELVFKELLSANDNADALTYYIKKSFEKYKLNFDNIETVSLSNGPGSFTGLRIGSAIAKGICFTTGSGLIEISTLDIIVKKSESEFLELKELEKLSEFKIVPLIFSNMKTLEFYYCEYGFDSNKLKRISDNKIDELEKIINERSLYVINEKIPDNIEKKYPEKIKDLSHISNISSQLRLTLQYVSEKKYSDYGISEPFYMKDFLPLIK